ncbi:protein BOB1 [Trichomonascus vanleenenianus]|uniref:Boi1p n=1 Tax=Trichomonascus vanleenenianus TaxID=2268995 RepID=UPI003ECBAC88
MASLPASNSGGGGEMENSQNEVEYLLGIHDFKGRSDDELSLKKGDHIQVIENDAAFGDGWYIGRNLTTGEAGLFPKVFTTALILPQSQASPSTSSSIPTVLQQSLLQQQKPLESVEEPPKSVGEYFVNHQTTHSGPVHETLTDIDQAISEINNNAISLPSFDNIPEWTPYDVQRYFEHRGYDPSVTSQFVHHKITGAILLELELSFLKEIDITSFGTRFEISKDIKYLNSVHKRRLQQRQEEQQAASSSGSRHRKGGSSFDRNWTPPAKRSSSTGTGDSGYVGSNPQTPLSMVENSHGSKASNGSSVEENDTSMASTVTKRPGSRNSNRKQSFVEGMRLQHSRQGSYDTIRAGEEQPLSHVEEEDERIYMSSRHSRSESSMAFDTSFKRHSHSGSQQLNLDISFTQDPKKLRRRSSMISGLMGSSVTGGLASQPSTPGTQPPHGQNTSHPWNFDEYDSSSQNITPASLEDNNSTPSLRSPLSQEDLSQFPAVKSKKNLSQDSLKKTSTGGSSGSTGGGSSGTSTPFGKMKVLRQASSQHNLRKPLSKQQTSAFTEGIKKVTASESSKTADYSGWMSKRGGMGVGAWRSRYFTLHGTRLSYFTNFDDTKERGLIDITAHRVLPARDSEDKLVALYAASVGAGRHVFKIVPPAPGSRKGVTFTAPKIHYFAVETRQEMREWMSAIMKATIDRDESVPILSSCATPTVSLAKAQEMFAESRIKDEEMRAKMIESNGTTFNYGGGGENSSIDSSDTNSQRSSSRAGSSNTNSTSLKMSPPTSEVSDFMKSFGGEVRHLTTKTAGLKIVTDLENEAKNKR